MAKKHSGVIKQKSSTATSRKSGDIASDQLPAIRPKDFAGMVLILLVTLIA